MPSARACFAGASSGSLNRWPIHSNLLFWIFLLHSTVFVLEYRSLFDIFFGHAIFKIFLSSDLWKMLMSSARFFFCQSPELGVVQKDAFYVRVEDSDLVFDGQLLLLKAIFNLLKARMAKHFLLEISLLVSYTYIHTYNRLLYSAISDDHSAQNKIKYTTKTSRIQVNKQNALNLRKQIGFQLFF